VQEHVHNLIRVESKWIHVVANVEADAHQRDEGAFDSVLESEKKLFTSSLHLK
jgi:hypothetical protein